LAVFGFLTGMLRADFADFERVCWVPVFNTMNSRVESRYLISRPVSTVVYEAGVQEGTSAPPKVLICQKSGNLSENTEKIPQNLGRDVPTPLFSLCDE